MVLFRLPVPVNLLGLDILPGGYSAPQWIDVPLRGETAYTARADSRYATVSRDAP